MTRSRRPHPKPLVDAETVIYRLNEAGKTLLALPSKGTRPADYGNGWPDVVHEVHMAYGYTAARMRPAVPSAAQITRMDEALAWVRHIPADRASHRRIVLMRLLVDPVTERHLFSWRRIGKAHGWSHEAVRMWHAQAIDWIIARVGPEMRRRSRHKPLDAVDTFGHSNPYADGDHARRVTDLAMYNADA